MPLRRGYDKERDEGESVGLLDEEPPIRLESLHYKKTEDHGSPGRRKPPEPTIQCDIQPSDTLLSLSLKYNVPIAELKRVNNILTDQGFFALKRIKIPVKPYSLLLPDVHGSERGQNNNGWLTESTKASPAFSSNISSRVSTACSSPYSELGSPGEEEGEGNLSLGEQDQLLFHESKDKKKVKRFLKGMDKDLDRIKEKHSELISVAEDPVLIKEPIKFPLRASQIPTEDPGDLFPKNYFHKTALAFSGCSNRVLCCWCGIVGILILVVFVILVSLMGNPHDTHHDNWGTSNLETESSATPKL